MTSSLGARRDRAAAESSQEGDAAFGQRSRTAVRIAPLHKMSYACRSRTKAMPPSPASRLPCPASGICASYPSREQSGSWLVMISQCSEQSVHPYEKQIEPPNLLQISQLHQ